MHMHMCQNTVFYRVIPDWIVTKGETLYNPKLNHLRDAGCRVLNIPVYVLCKYFRNTLIIKMKFS